MVYKMANGWINWKKMQQKLRGKATQATEARRSEVAMSNEGRRKSYKDFLVK